ncbi:Type II secretory pathway ATPase GspE/PulE or T4P pilus assembly pathway ATPase PilB [Desulfatibacillum alkenivorans DSM 16219]|uniref:Type II secretory pathway ATPase GspE/PulE or T4P pilus assembly pathway ATPase PilB n=1 Tax=Desulfatibacillum alkenivorans DSM 16219 TaxID=1121393 RepID=A0A1M6JAN1_9BACT|nr:ATPase, T2SS/T4P/T4SS family [Desulfatibacillum alkenivorans]SHJ43702.1 Type II secretory pathway ATPase GspE/PulE or T4P pilus assembly pathway ATPase PilB [Desulfatibacillum alkenivorans DSM 16219]
MPKLASLFMGGKAQEAKEVTSLKKESSRYAILFVDDEPHVLKAMRRIFRKENYRLLTAESAEEALETLKAARVHVIVSDHRMPGMQGADLLRKVKELYPQTIRIMLTGHADVNAIMGAINEGAVYKFITKPWNDDDLRITVGLALEQYDLIKENVYLKNRQKEQSKKIKTLTKCFSANRSQIGRMLVKRNLLTKEDLEKALQVQARSDKILPAILMEMKLADEKTIMDVMEEELKVNRVNPAEFTASAPLASLIPSEICEKHLLVPLKRMDGQLVTAMADPTDLVKIDELRFLTGMPIKPALATQEEIRSKVQELYGGESSLNSVISEIELMDPTETIEIILEEDDVVDVDELLKSKDQPPAIRIVNSIISDALRHGASDVHIEPKTKYLMVRYRIDDLLQEKIRIPMAMHPPIVSRIKVMSELDITERRKPQDGRVTVKASTKTVDMRISSLPTVNGEKIVLRILDKSAASQELEDLGLTPMDMEKILRFIRQPQGMVLATGPTGSGKTSTLYAMLRRGASITKNFTTIEDPVEYHMGMAEQVNVREKIGLDFPTILRSILRQDPNVIMLGEIRDFQTAEVAFHAALTGHLVLSTLHTNGSIASIIRLRDMGIKSYVMSEALTGIIAQRLLRRICPHCMEDAQVDADVLKALRLDPERLDFTPKKGRGCPQCNGGGYKGRIGVYEVLEFDSEFRRMVHSGASDAELMRAASQANMKTILEDSMDKVRAGISTCEEVLRVLGPQNTLEILCPACNHAMAQRFNYCPHCAAALVLRCRSCHSFLEESWKICPHCGAPSPLLDKE